jgi:hypothetical protein
VQVQAPDPCPLWPGQPDGVVVAILEPADPVPERLGVVLGKALYVPGHETGPLQRELDS